MSRKSAPIRKRKNIIPSASSPQNQPKSGPPQFLVDAADVANVGEYDKAIDFLKQGIGQDRFAACKGIGEIHLILNENEKAVEWLEKARECNPESSLLEIVKERVLGIQTD